MAKLLTLDIDRLKIRAAMNEREPCGTLKNSIIRARRILKILDRDKFSCTKCGSKDNLTIDHPNGRKFARHNNYEKYKVSKCTTLCCDCHMIKNGWIKFKNNEIVKN